MRRLLFALLLGGAFLGSINEKAEACGRRHRGGRGGGESEGAGCSSCGQAAQQTGCSSCGQAAYSASISPTGQVFGANGQFLGTLGGFNAGALAATGPPAGGYSWQPIPGATGQHALFLGSVQVGAVDPAQGYRPFDPQRQLWGEATASPIPSPIALNPNGLGTASNPTPMPRK
jgi:hypothetical protein